jgi:hypothetical protein
MQMNKRALDEKGLLNQGNALPEIERE